MRKDSRFDMAGFLRAAWYDRGTGYFYWMDSAPTSFAGKRAGSVNRFGYECIGWKRSSIGTHRLAFYIGHGRWPVGMADHINGNKSDNRIENIREADHAQNQWNVGIPKRNKSGYPGVHWLPKRRQWIAAIMVRGKYIYLGRFDDAGAGYAAYLMAKAKYHPFSPSGRNLPPVPEKYLNLDVSQLRPNRPLGRPKAGTHVVE